MERLNFDGINGIHGMEKWEKPRKKPFVTVWGVVALLGVIMLWVVVSIPTSGGLYEAKKAKLQNDFNQVQTAELNYYTEYSDYPVAPDNAALIHMLDGSKNDGNTRQIAFLSLKPSDRDAKGELLDPWGTPIEMSVDSDGNFRARSAGPDKTFGTADDIARRFNQPGSK